METADLKYLAAIIGRDQFCTWLGINSRTLKRWENGSQPIPRPVALLVDLHLNGDLAAIGDDWRGFTINGGKLFAPYHRRGFTPLQLAAAFFELQELHHLRREVKTLTGQLEAVRREKAKLWAAQKVRSLIRS